VGFYSPEKLRRIEGIQKGTAELEAKLKKDHPGWESGLKAWEEEANKQRSRGRSSTRSILASPAGSSTRTSSRTAPFSPWAFAPRASTFTRSQEQSLPASRGCASKPWTHGDLPFGGPGRNDKGTFAISEVGVEVAAPSAPASRAKREAQERNRRFRPGRSLRWRSSSGKAPRQAVGRARLVPHRRQGRDRVGRRRGPGRRNQDSKAVVQLESPSWPADGAELKITLKYRHGGADIHGSQSNFLGRVRFSVTSAPNPTADPLPRVGARGASRSARGAPARRARGDLQATGGPPSPSSRRPTTGSRPCGPSTPKATRSCASSSACRSTLARPSSLPGATGKSPPGRSSPASRVPAPAAGPAQRQRA